LFGQVHTSSQPVLERPKDSLWSLITAKSLQANIPVFFLSWFLMLSISKPGLATAKQKSEGFASIALHWTLFLVVVGVVGVVGGAGGVGMVGVAGVIAGFGGVGAIGVVGVAGVAGVVGVVGVVA